MNNFSQNNALSVFMSFRIQYGLSDTKFLDFVGGADRELSGFGAFDGIARSQQ